MSPYRTHSIDERRVRRLIRKQSRLDKRILQRAEKRFQKELRGLRIDIDSTNVVMLVSAIYLGLAVAYTYICGQ